MSPAEVEIRLTVEEYRIMRVILQAQAARQVASLTPRDYSVLAVMLEGFSA